MSHAAWMEQAASDLAAARSLSEANHHSQAVWLAGQAVEKAHKAILAALGLRYEERHYKHLGHTIDEISKLLPLALHEPTDPAIATMLEKLQSRALASRYPAPGPGTGVPQLVAPASSPSFAASAKDVNDAATLVDWCRKRVERGLRAVQAMRPE